MSRTGTSGLVAIMGAATLYGIGKTFFWPTMLGITAEQCPKGGALTLNAIAGIGMIAVGVLGFPFIGALQERTASAELRATSPEIAQQILVEKPYMGITYAAIHPERAREVTSPDARTALDAANQAGQFDALAKMALFPGFMLVCYIGLFLYFKSRGGYTAVHLGAESDVTHPSHREGPGVDRDVTADEAYADGIVGPNE